MNFLFVSIKKLLALDGGPAVSERIIKLSDGSKEWDTDREWCLERLKNTIHLLFMWKKNF